MTVAPNRRTVLGVAAGGAVAVGVGGLAVDNLGRTAAVAATPGVLDLYINEGFVPMVDGSLVYMRGYGERPTTINDASPSLSISPQLFLADGRLESSRVYPTDAEVPHDGRPEPAGDSGLGDGLYRARRAHWASFFPRRTIVAETGSTVRLRVHNRLAEPHAFQIPMVVSTGPIAPGASVDVTFTPRTAGTHVYQDPGYAPVERVLGLHGVLVVIPAGDRWRNAPGGTEFERQWLWICQDVDPEWSRRANAGEVIDPVKTPAVPRYFMLNDRSGYLSLGVSRDDLVNHAAHEETLAAGFPRAIDVRDFSKPDGQGSVGSGQLIRMVNVGAVVHQMHFHGNHVWTVRKNDLEYPRDGRLGRIEDGHVVLQQWEDVVELDALERKEIVLPMRRPPDALDEVWDARTEDWHYPMHCHAEPSQTAAGGLYPGGLVADWVLAGPSSPQHPTYRSQAEFSSKQHKEDDPVTEFRQQPDRTFSLDFYSRRLRFPDGADHLMWSFESQTSGRRFPAPLIRATEGEIVHLLLEPSKRAHTIHLHGMEPDPRNDGVGHTSFEVTGSYTYQWRPERGAPGDPNAGTAGTYFYHCHVNTVLHVQMGMVGAMIIDPVVHPDYPVLPGARRSFVDGPLYDIATEAMLIPYSVDPGWHQLDHASGLSGEDVGLNRFGPSNFYVLGGALAGPPSRADVWSPQRLKVNLSGNRSPTLLRVLNLNYFPTRMRFTTAAGTPVRMGELLAHDGRAFRDTRDPTGPSRPPRDIGNLLLASMLVFGAAERYDMLLHPPGAGTFLVHFDFIHWVTGLVLATRSVRLDAS
ncbi:MAG: multicopper oxidase domain-containing protein [Nocardioides sp.]